jgi:DNA-binding transcriptional ArsR family regulator
MVLLELEGPSGRELMPLDDTRPLQTIGKHRDRDIVIPGDDAVSRLHARLELVGHHWFVEDLNSTNGTIVNGEPIFAPQVLHDGDELLLGRTRVRYRDMRRLDEGETTTAPLKRAPKVTQREHQVLVELCRAFFEGRGFSSAATVKQIADRLYVGEPAVRQHLLTLYEKYSIAEGSDVPRRQRLYEAAVQRGAVGRGDYEHDAG